MVPDRCERTTSLGVSRRSFVAAASAVGAGGIAGCLGRGAEEGAVVAYGDTDFQDIMDPEGELHQALWDAGLDEDITVSVRTGPDETEQRRSAAQSALQAERSQPDLFMMDSGWTIPFILREQTVNLEDRLSNETLGLIENEYLEAAVETARHPETGELHALPLFPDFGTMQYREDLAEDAGYDTEDWGTEPMSWQEFSEVAADVRADSGVDFGFTTQAAAYEGLACCTFNEVISTWGGAYFGGLDELFEAGGREVTVDEEPVLDAIRMMRTFVRGQDDEHALEGYEQIAPTAIVQYTEEDARGPFAGGNVVMHRNWPYSIAIAHDDGMGDQVGMMPMPYGVEEDEAAYDGLGGTAAALGGWHLTLNPASENQEEATQVLEAFATEEVMLTVFEVQGWIPPIVELLEDVDPEEIGPVAEYAETIEIAGENAVPRPVTDIWPEQSAHIYQEVNAAYRGVKSPEEAMADLADRLEASEADVGEQDVQ
ncbi:extracellular solute-binding protein [Natronococcus occultus]|uniref:ABC-type sugar transport system, periplasmic component n=1 Tax=Natronococcus occultus SP4 TaxID=694430 RepID=L0JWX2_9EURY|nr:extracellular solute-binding protein [Natronococcus occultus]AGB37542.1 ABC-type sugar transport system, periplasmic component [Natronococcus occultus SP4]